MNQARLAEQRHDLVPKRRACPVPIGLRRRGLRRAHRIGCRKSVDQAGFQSLGGLPVGLGGFARVGGVLVMGRRIEFLSHVASPSPDNASAIRTFPWTEVQTCPRAPALAQSLADRTRTMTNRLARAVAACIRSDITPPDLPS